MTTLITKEQLQRVESGKKDITDPCFICGHQFNAEKCSHTVEQTEVIFNIVQNMTAEEKAKLRRRPDAKS
jgi:hypothetical protein